MTKFDGIRLHQAQSFSEPAHFGFGGCTTFILALTRLESIIDGECQSPAVVALPFVNVDAVGVHRPVVVGAVENIACRQLHLQSFGKKRFANGSIHREPCSAEAIGVHIAR